MIERTRVLTSVVAALVLITAVSIGSPLSAQDGAVVGQQQSAESSFVVVDRSLSTPAVANNSTEVRATATIRNDGATRRTEEVDFRLQGEGRDIVTHRDVTIPSNESQQVTFVVDTTGFEPGSYIVGITTRDSSQFAELDVSNLAGIDIDEQETNGTFVEVDEAFLPRGGYVAIYEGGATQNVTTSDIIGVSDYMVPGFYEDVIVDLFDVPGATFETNSLTGNRTLVAVPHQETTNDRTFGFVTGNENADGPYILEGAPVSEAAPVNVTG